MDFTAAAEDQPINLCEKLAPGAALGTPSYPSDGCGTDGLRSRVKYGVKSTPEVCGPQAVCSGMPGGWSRTYCSRAGTEAGQYL